jgi:hypothetical protein
MSTAREIDFGTLLHQQGDEIIRIVASGDLDLSRYPWLHLHLHSLNDPMRQSLDLVVELRLDRHDHRVGPGVLHLAAAHWRSQVSVGMMELKYSRLKPEEFLREGLQQLLADVSPRVYEHDPRIGMFPTEGSIEPLPRSPLFDPQSLFPRPDLEALSSPEVSFDPWENGKPPPLWAYGKCRFCDKEFHAISPMWGGGNLLWVHQPCWFRVVGIR